MKDQWNCGGEWRVEEGLPLPWACLTGEEPWEASSTCVSSRDSCVSSLSHLSCFVEINPFSGSFTFDLELVLGQWLSGPIFGGVVQNRIGSVIDT